MLFVKLSLDKSHYISVRQPLLFAVSVTATAVTRGNRAKRRFPSRRGKRTVSRKFTSKGTVLFIFICGECRNCLSLRQQAKTCAAKPSRRLPWAFFSCFAKFVPFGRRQFLQLHTLKRRQFLQLYTSNAGSSFSSFTYSTRLSMSSPAPSHWNQQPPSAPQMPPAAISSASTSKRSVRASSSV